MLETRFDTPGSGLYAEIRSASGETIWRSQSTTGTDVQFGPPLEGGERSFFFTDIAGTAVRLAVASRGIVWDDLHGQPARFTFSVASSLEAYDAQIASFRQQIVGWFVGAGAAAHRDARAAAALAARSRCAGWSARSRKWKPAAREQLGEAWPQELRGGHQQSQRAARGRAHAHQALSRHARQSRAQPEDAAGRHAPGAAGGGADRRSAALDSEIDRMSGIIEHQMKRAAASGGVLLGQAPVDVAPIVTELRVALLKVYGNKDLLFEDAIAAGAQFIGDRADLTELLGNLLDNACKWAQLARAHRGGRRCARRTRAPRCALVIEDDGPGIAEADRARVLARGGRADEATPGHGIGLAMVHDTVALYGGTMQHRQLRRSAARASSSNYPGRHAKWGQTPFLWSSNGV